MDRKFDWNDTEIKIRDEFQQIYDDQLWGANDNKPKPDLSFMSGTYCSSFQWKNLSKVAVFILSVMIFSSGIAIWINSDHAVASKFKLDQIMYEMKNDTDNISTMDDTISYKTATMNDIDEAKEFYPSLYVPSNIPKGYELQKLQIDKLAGEEYFTNYMFVNEKKNVIDVIINSSTTPGTLEIAATTKLVKLENTDLYVWYDSTSEALRGVCLLDNNTLLSISGVPDQETMINVITSFNKTK